MENTGTSTTITIPTTTTIPFNATTTSPFSTPCLIETLYGNHSATTDLIRCFRDTFLRHTAEGREIIECYNRWNGLLIEAIEKDNSLKEHLKKTIDTILPILIP